MIKRRFIRLLSTSAFCCFALTACNGDPNPGRTGGVALAQVTTEELPGSDGIPCPPGNPCPVDEAGVVFPGSIALRKEEIICVASEPRAQRPDVCPAGFNGRLWKPVNSQQACHPRSTEERCNKEGIKGKYAFLCKRKNPSTKNCPGVTGIPLTWPPANESVPKSSSR